MITPLLIKASIFGGKIPIFPGPKFKPVGGPFLKGVQSILTDRLESEGAHVGQLVSQPMTFWVPARNAYPAASPQTLNMGKESPQFTTR